VSLEIRAARIDDLPGISRLAGELVRQHHAFDPHRFLLVEDVESGYASWFARELRNPRALILCAGNTAEIAAYSYSLLEGRDWNALLDAHAAIHDIYVAESARRGGLGRRLLEATLDALSAKGASLVVLHTAAQNEPAQRLFAKAGFQVSMLEMSRRLAP
jgi:ribosomal protein S18 acetylase RimI-like enzyme